MIKNVIKHKINFSDSLKIKELSKRIKKPKTSAKSPELVAIILPHHTKMKKSSEKRAPKEHLRVLVDSGATGRILLKKHAKNHGLNSKKTTSWKTAAGIATTYGEVSINFMLPEFSESKIINHEFHVMKGSPDFPYYMVLGQDVIKELGINIDFKSQQKGSIKE